MKSLFNYHLMNFYSSVASNPSIPRPDGTITPFQKHLSKLSQTPNNSSSMKNQSSLIFDKTQFDASDPTLTKNDLTAKESTLTNSPAKNQSFDISKLLYLLIFFFFFAKSLLYIYNNFTDRSSPNK